MTRAIALAALSARTMAEAAVRDGFEAIALDLFGDADTCAVASEWVRIGTPASMRIDADALCAALSALATQRGAIGWIAGSDLEGRPDLLLRAAACLPLIGTAPEAISRVRDPGAFFEFLDDAGIAHPEVRFEAPADARGWLLKDPLGAGGWHIRRADEHVGLAAPPRCYWQRDTPGRPMSATFVADGRDARVLGFNRLTVRAIGAHPYVYCGIVGPVPLSEAAHARAIDTVRRICGHFHVRGLGSLDFLLDGDEVRVLELNPRPPASLALYPQRQPIALHVAACLDHALPAQGELAEGTPRGVQTLFARRALWLDDAKAGKLASRGDVHDRPRAGQRFAPGDPVCTVSAQGADADAVAAALARASDEVFELLEHGS